MNSEHNSPDRFEDRLLHELKQFVAAQPVPQEAAGSSARTKPFHRPRYRVALVGAAMIAVAAVAVAAGHDPASPAYAVESQPNGSISVEINSLSDAAGLQSRLRAQGIAAVVRYLPDGKVCEPSLKDGPRAGMAVQEASASIGDGKGVGAKTLHSESGVDAVAGESSGTVVRTRKGGEPPKGLPDGDVPPMGMIKAEHANGSTKFTVPINAVPKGKTLVIDGNSGEGPSLLSVGIISGKVDDCKLVDAPEPPEFPAPAK
jgi:hypothetical protein